MMFAARGIAISFSVFVIVYCALSLVVCFTWRKVWRWGQRHPVRRRADWLFILRMSPLVTAGLITTAFTVPSFLLLEPRAIDEPVGRIPLVLSLCGVALGMLGVGNAVKAAREAARRVAVWASDAQAMESGASVPVLRVSRVAPAMTAAGILRPIVLLSSTAESVLTAGELQTALSHEVEHVRRWDNLRKLLLRLVAFPGLGGLEAAWLEASEMAADDAAVSNPAEALDLAAALVKLARLGPLEAPLDLTASIVHGPAPIINARVERLLAWGERQPVQRQRHSLWYGLSAALATVTMFAVTYTQLLVRVHTATEWLVR